MVSYNKGCLSLAHNKLYFVLRRFCKRKTDFIFFLNLNHFCEAVLKGVSLGTKVKTAERNHCFPARSTLEAGDILFLPAFIWCGLLDIEAVTQT